MLTKKGVGWFVQVRIQATDKGVPPRTATAAVEVNVQRDDGQLAFTAQTYSVQVSENRDVGNTIGNVKAAPGVGFPEIQASHRMVQRLKSWTDSDSDLFTFHRAEGLTFTLDFFLFRRTTSGTS